MGESILDLVPVEQMKEMNCLQELGTSTRVMWPRSDRIIKLHCVLLGSAQSRGRSPVPHVVDPTPDVPCTSSLPLGHTVPPLLERSAEEVPRYTISLCLLFSCTVPSVFSWEGETYVQIPPNTLPEPFPSPPSISLQ